MQPIVVYDTNVLISGTIWGGVPYAAIQLAKRGSIEAITCTEILDEFEEKLTTKFNFSPSQTSEVITNLLGFHQTVKITNSLTGITLDPDDDKIVECAVVGGRLTLLQGIGSTCYPLKTIKAF